MADDGPTLDSSLRLTEATVPTCSLNVELPWPVDERLGRLVDLVRDEGLGPTSKRELAAALLYAASPAGLQLWEAVVNYRRATVRDAAFWASKDDERVTFQPRKPGPKSR
jgi:hypothetical protein